LSRQIETGVSQYSRRPRSGTNPREKTQGSQQVHSTISLWGGIGTVLGRDCVVNLAEGEGERFEKEKDMCTWAANGV